MARKSTLGNVFSKTETAGKIKPVEEPKKTPLSVYLTMDQKIQIAKIADELGESKHFVMQQAIYYFLKDWNEGAYQIKTEQVTKKTIVSK